MNIKLIILMVVLSIFAAGCGDDKQISLTETNDMETSYISEEDSGEIYVFISGKVKKPGVYQLKQGDRVYQAIEMAGGLKKNADSQCVNQAETVVDGQAINITSRKKIKEEVYNSEVSDDTLININTADKNSLTSLPGIGDSKAHAIITYREENGNFGSIEDIKNVSGIGDSTYMNICDLISV